MKSSIPAPLSKDVGVPITNVLLQHRPGIMQPHCICVIHPHVVASPNAFLNNLQPKLPQLHSSTHTRACDKEGKVQQ